MNVLLIYPEIPETFWSFKHALKFIRKKAASPPLGLLTVAAMAAAGFTTVFIGIETPDEDSLLECNKKQNKNRDLVADVKRMQRAGLQVQGGFIIGFDSDTPSIFQRQIEFIQKSGIVMAMVGLLQAPPGARLYERLKGKGACWTSFPATTWTASKRAMVMLMGLVVSLFEGRQEQGESSAGDRIAGKSASRGKNIKEAEAGANPRFETESKILPK